MSNSIVGYKKPPRQTCWKKGQCGNPRGIRKSARRDTIELIDSIFRTKIRAGGDDDLVDMTTLEGIVLQLWGKSISGDARATNVLLRYQKLDPPVVGKGHFIVRGGLPKLEPET